MPETQAPQPFTLNERATNVHTLCLGPHTLYFSYAQCIAYDGPAWPVPCRRLNTSATSRRHLGIVGAMGWLKLPDEVFDHVLKKAFPKEGK